jgi:hypothetical protein
MIDAPHIFYYFQHVLHHIQKARSSIGMCSKFIISLIKFSNFFAAQQVTIPQIFTRARGPLAASAHEVDTAQVRVLIGCVFVEIVIESETCHICRAVLLTI